MYSVTKYRGDIPTPLSARVYPWAEMKDVGDCFFVPLDGLSQGEVRSHLEKSAVARFGDKNAICVKADVGGFFAILVQPYMGDSIPEKSIAGRIMHFVRCSEGLTLGVIRNKMVAPADVIQTALDGLIAQGLVNRVETGKIYQGVPVVKYTVAP